MNKRESIIEAFDNDADRVLAAKVIDCIGQVLKYHESRFTHFLDPAEVNKVKKIIGNFDVKYSISSGVEGCERNIAVIYPAYMAEENIELPVSVLKIHCKNRFEKISHRDMLGALMGLGIKRENIGDIIIGEQVSYVFVYKDISYYVSINLVMVRHTPVVAEYADFKEVPAKRYDYKEIISNVASLRLDAILSAGFGESRSSISREVLAGNVKVNWEETKELSCIIKQGDVLSLKGKGRIILDEIGGTTKKGRTNVKIKRTI